MSPDTVPVHPTTLDRVRWRFEHWRQTRPHPSRIPEALWTVAVAAAKTHGLHRTARALRLNYTDLKRRRGGADDAAARTPFVELLSGPGPTSPPCTLELESARGTKLRLQLPGITPPDLTALSRTLWQMAR